MPDTVGEPVTELVVELVDGSEPVRGRITARTGLAAEFNGWTEFAAVLDRLRGPDLSPGTTAVLPRTHGCPSP